MRKIRLNIFLFILLCISALTLPIISLAEVQVSVTDTCTVPNPGSSTSSCSLSSTFGGSSSLSYTRHNYYGGVQAFIPDGSTATGRFSGLTASSVRYGITFDSFEFIQSATSKLHWSLATSNTTCPGATTYNWLMLRFRTADLLSSNNSFNKPMDFTSATQYVGGTLSYSASTFTGVNYFDLDTLTNHTSSSGDWAPYSYSGFSGASCSSGTYRVQAGTANAPLDLYGYVYFGTNAFMHLSAGGNPVVALGLPQQNLTNAVMQNLVSDVLTGFYSYHSAYLTMEQKTVYFVPTSGTFSGPYQFNIYQSSTNLQASSPTVTVLTSSTQAPSSQTQLGTLTCDTLNSPAQGFCSGTLSLNGVTGTGKAVCEFYTGSSGHILACTAQYPSAKQYAVSFIAQTPASSLVANTLDSSGYVGLASGTASGSLTATLTNMTGRPISSLGNPSTLGQNAALNLSSPFVAPTYSGAGGVCGSTLGAYASCTLSLTYSPSGSDVSKSTFRAAYDSGGGGVVNATAVITGSRGLSSISVSPGSAGYAAGTTQQATATATFADASTADISSIATWASSATSVTTVSSSGLLSFLTVGTSNITAAFGSTTSSASTSTVYNPVTLTAVSDKNFPSNYLDQGATFSQDFNNISGGSPGNDTGMTYSCLYGQPVSGVYTAATNCTSLPGTVSLNTSTGSFSWTPNAEAIGPYQIVFKGTDANAIEGTTTFVIDVRPPYATSNLRGNWSAQFADLTSPYATANTSWKDLTSNAYHGTLSSSSHATWSGTGSVSSPYSLSLDGSGYVDFGNSLMSGQTKLMFTSWVSPSSVSTGDVVIFGNNANGTGNGFTVRQSKSQSGKMEFVVGKSYQDTILADSPVLYWRLGEASGTSAVDISASGYNGTYTSSPTLSQTGALTADSDKSVVFTGSNYVIQTSTGNLTGSSPSTESIEMWVKPTSVGTSMGLYQTANGLTSPTPTRLLQVATNGKVRALPCNVAYTDYTTSALSSGAWTHIVWTRNGTTNLIYINGTQETSNSISATCGMQSTYLANGFPGYFSGAIDEFAIYNTTLSAGQVAAHYNAGIATYGSICTSTTSFSNSTWNFISGLFDGSSTKFFVNGKQECSVSSAPATLSSPTTSFTVGATASNSKDWTGKISDLKIYGTSNGSAVGTSADIKTNYDATADLYRATSVGNIVTSNLVLNLDAANAKTNGLEPYSNGCAAGDLSWYDLSSNAFTGTLTSFSSCGSSTGWNGDGTKTISGTAGPYRATFNGSSNYVDVGSSATLKGLADSSFTVEAWVYSSLNSTDATIVGNAWDTAGWHLRVSSANKGRLILITNGTNYKYSETSVLSAGWHHLAGTWNGTSAITYVDGASSSSTSSSGSLSGMTSTLNTYVGNLSGQSKYFVGSIALVRIYSSALSSSAISQNCKANQARFTGASCN